MKKMDVNIDDLVPHRRPMRLIDEVLEIGDDAAVSAAVVSQRWPLLNDDGANPIVLIELVAQTAAVLGGFKKQKDGDAIGGGMIVAVKSAVFFTERIPVNARIITRSTTRPLLENFKEVSGVAEIDQSVVAEITLQSVTY